MVSTNGTQASGIQLSGVTKEIQEESIMQVTINIDGKSLKTLFSRRGIAILFVLTIVSMAFAITFPVSKPHSFTGGTTISSSEVNANFDTLFTAVNTLASNGSAIPTGAIIMWSGAVGDIPSGWALCDGASGRPDLRGRFIVGAGGTYNPGNIGGSDTCSHTHSVPSHYHGKGNMQITSSGSHTHYYWDLQHHGIYGTNPQDTGAAAVLQGGTSVGLWQSYRTSEASTHTHANSSFSGNVGNTGGVNGDSSMTTGGASSTENRPPYYALCFIIKL